MQALSAADILDVWDVGRRQSLADRALTLLERAHPESGRDALARLPLGTRDRLLLEMRAAVLGRALEATATCPACGELLEFELAIDDLLAPKSDGRPSDDEHEMEIEGYELRFRLLDSTDLLAAAACPDEATSRTVLLQRCVLASVFEGAEVDPVDLPPPAVSAIGARLADLDPRVETALALTCPTCGEAWNTDLDLAGFIWQEIRARALCLLDEVDTLARAYGWSESEILALGALRRRSYLERLI